MNVHAKVKPAKPVAAPAEPSLPDSTTRFTRAVLDLETPLYDAKYMADISITLIERALRKDMSDAGGHKHCYYITAEQLNCILFAAGRAASMVANLADAWDAATDLRPTLKVNDGRAQIERVQVQEAA